MDGIYLYSILFEKHKGKGDHFEDLRAAGRIILGWIFKIQV
jgi:hypothetical protein